MPVPEDEEEQALPPAMMVDVDEGEQPRKPLAEVLGEEAAPAEVQPAPEGPLDIRGPRDWLRAHDVDESQFERLFDGTPVDENDTELLLDVMYWLERLPQTLKDKWIQAAWDLSQLASEPDPRRGELFLLSGRVEAIGRVEPVPEVVERLEFDEYFRCVFRLPSGRTAVVFAQHVPETWAEAIRGESAAGAPQSGYRASVQGLFLKLAADDPEDPKPVFVATRVAWHPDTPLGNLGMDVGLLEAVENRRPLTGKDRECFYQMLAAVGGTEPGELMRRAEAELERTGKEKYSVVPLFNDAETQHGRIVSLHGTTRRLVKIQVGDEDIIERFGIDHYYEMALYTADSQGNPLMFCLLELPEGMPTGDGPQYGEEVRVAGFFMKTWAYRSHAPDSGSASESDSESGFRLAPLLIGRRPIWYPREPQRENTTLAAIAGGLFVLALIGVWIGVWRYNRADRQFHERTIAKSHSLDSGLSLDEIGLDAEGKPDFSGLSEADRGGKEESG